MGAATSNNRALAQQERRALGGDAVRTEEIRSSASGMLAQDQAFVEAVGRKDPTRVRSPYIDAARTLAVTLAAEESARTNQPIDVPKL